MKHRSPTLLFVSLLALLAAGRTGAQALTDPTESKAREILEQAIEALGGQAFLSARDFRGQGRAFQFGRDEELSGMAKFITYEKYPDKERQEFGEDRDFIVVINGEKGWDKNPRGVREYPADEMERIRDNQVRSIEEILRYRMKEPGIHFRLAGTDMITNRRVDLVEVLDEKNRSVIIAVEQDSRLPVRREWERRNRLDGLRDVEMELLGNYRKVGGIQTPHYRLRERNGQKILEMFITSSAYNVNLADSLFQRPPGPARPEPPGRRKHSSQ